MAFNAKVEERAVFEKLLEEHEVMKTWSSNKLCKYLAEHKIKVSPQTLDKWRQKGPMPKELPRLPLPPMSEVVRAGGFDVKRFLSGNLEELTKAALEGALQGKAKQTEMLFKILGELTEKKEVKNERTNADIARDAEEFLIYLRDRYDRSGGICPVCGKSQALSRDVLQDKVNGGEVPTVHPVPVPA